MPLGRSWILLGGVLPVDYDDLCLAELEPGRRFLERSRTLAFRVWQHERVVEPEGAGACGVTDRARLRVQAPRSLWIPGAERLAAAIVRRALPPPPPASARTTERDGETLRAESTVEACATGSRGHRVTSSADLRRPRR